MAQQPTVKRAEETPRNKGGRPRNSAAPPVQVGPVIGKFDYGAKSTFRRCEDFTAYLAAYPNTTGLLAYIYRLKPKIDFSLAGRSESSIWKTSVPAEMTEEFIGAKFGRGFYNLKLNDANAVGGAREVAKTWFTISDPDLPPIYDPRTLLLADPENQDEVARLLQAGTLIRDSQNGLPRLRNENDGGSGAQLPTAAAAAPPELFGRDVLSQIVLAALNRGNQSPHDAVKDTIAVAQMLTSRDASPAFDADAIVEKVVARLGGGGVGPTADFQAYERVEKFINRVRGTADSVAGVVTSTAAPAAGGDAGIMANAAGWMPHIAPAIAQARALLGDIFGFMKSNSTGRAADPGAQQNHHAPPDATMTLERLIEEVATLGLQKMEEGVTGFDFAAYVCIFHRPPQGLEVFRQLDAMGGTAGVMALMAFNPLVRPMLSDQTKRAQIEGFLDSFFSFEADALGADSLDAPVETAPPARPNGAPAAGA